MFEQPHAMIGRHTCMRPTPAVIAAVLVAALSGCGGTSPSTPLPTPAKTVVVHEKWQVETCKYLAGQTNPEADGFAHTFAAGIAEQSTDPAFVELAGKSRAAGNSNLLRGWCQKNMPESGATPFGPAPSG